ncbi:coiled-coil domain-containing protein 24 isoform X2 [Kryptolebias marmoratus]|uniref:coiled-coil domain-containing protein 24 isoform X2 n=1 Tax=Kryptolebias marmoratus TaxID=37003 RepID=UPI000D52F6B1|nr:coiled-coil domain-containing protein 24 isoform X2 [Kryptolebias marmoratus]
MNSPGESQLWCPGQSLWSLIAEHVSESELLKIRAELGHSVVDMYTEVHTEAVMWHKMWQGRQQHGNHNIRAETPFAGPRGSPLPDPPVVKELVRAEVKMLLQTLKEKAGRSGRDDEELLFGYKPETVHYALGHQEICHNSSVNAENTDNTRRPNSCCSVQSSAEDEIESIRDKLNVKEIHKVVARLRSVLLSESESLSIMTKIIKGNIKQTHQYEPYMTEPSLTELRELRAAVQTDLKLLPSSPEVSSPPPVKKNNFRLLCAVINLRLTNLPYHCVVFI